MSRAAAAARSKAALIAIAALVISPLGYLLIAPLAPVTAAAARRAVLIDLTTVAETGSTNADVWRSPRRARPKGCGCAPSARPPGADGRDATGYRRAGNLYASTLVRLRPAIRLRRRWRWSRR